MRPTLAGIGRGGGSFLRGSMQSGSGPPPALPLLLDNAARRDVFDDVEALLLRGNVQMVLVRLQ
jgi:hypothetical protein